jgi:hypothetical protein
MDCFSSESISLAGLVPFIYWLRLFLLCLCHSHVLALNGEVLCELSEKLGSVGSHLCPVSTSDPGKLRNMHPMFEGLPATSLAIST